MRKIIDIRERFESKIFYSPDGCWYWIGAQISGGYGILSSKFKKPNLLAHRLSYELYKGEIPKVNSYHGICVLHTCDNPLCVNPDHLTLGTQKDNIMDISKRGRRNDAKGSDCALSKLTEEQVLDIRSFENTRVNRKSLMAKYNIHRNTLSRIFNRFTWKHI